MSQALIRALNPEILRSPKKAAEAISDLAKQVDEIDRCKGDLKQLKNRGVFERLFANNTRDMASILLRQNDTMSAFLTIVQALIAFNMFNTSRLGKLYNTLLKCENQGKGFQSEHLDFAKAYIAQAYTAAKQFRKRLKNRDACLDSMKQQLLQRAEYEKQKDSLDQEQSQKLDSLEANLGEHEHVNRSQSEQLDELGKSVTTIEGQLASLERRLSSAGGNSIRDDRRMRLVTVLAIGLALAAVLEGCAIAYLLVVVHQ